MKRCFKGSLNDISWSSHEHSFDGVDVIIIEKIMPHPPGWHILQMLFKGIVQERHDFITQ